MKIVIVDISGVGGIGHYVFSLAKAVSKLDIEFFLISPKRTDFNLASYNIPVKYKIIPHYKFNNPILKSVIYLISRLRVLFFLLRLKPDIVHFHEIKLPFLDNFIFRILKSRGIKTILTLHHLRLFDFNISKRSFSRLYSICDGLILHSEANKNALINEYSFTDTERIAVIPHGEYSALFKNAGTKNECRQKLNIEKDKNVLLFFGYIRKYKGLDILLKAFTRVIEKENNFILIVAGNPKEDMNFYYQLINEKKIEEKIQFHPRYIEMDEIPVFFTASDCVILPYRDIFQSGLALLSYAYSRPVIATRVGGLPEIVEDGKTGILVQPEDPEELAETILKTFKNKASLIEMGNYADRYSKEHFSWDRIAEDTLDFYKKSAGS
ncbi:glycosyltransferase family 4 protein [candidate division KSB1 bacterium]